MRDRRQDESLLLLKVTDGEAENTDSLHCQPLRPTPIVFNLLLVDWAIHLATPLRGRTIKVEDEWADRMLSAEMKTLLVATQH